MMKRFGLVLGYIFTFGVLYVVLRKKARKRAQQINKQLTVSADIPFAIDDLIAALGGIKNIEQTFATISAFKAVLKVRGLVDDDALRKLKPKGLMWDGTAAVTLLFGDCSGAIKKQVDALCAQQVTESKEH